MGFGGCSGCELEAVPVRGLGDSSPMARGEGGGVFPGDSGTRGADGGGLGERGGSLLRMLPAVRGSGGLSLTGVNGVLLDAAVGIVDILILV